VTGSWQGELLVQTEGRKLAARPRKEERRLKKGKIENKTTYLYQHDDGLFA
jgi:hypothetical protein